MTALSAVVRKNIYLDRHYYKLYPNIYVFLVARSGLRKSNPVTMARKLVQETNTTRVILGRNSVQAVLKELGKAYSIEGGGVLKDASAFLVSGELASFLVKDPEALTILTDLYDTFACEPEWKNTLKVSGVDTLKNPCITLLGATNEVHFKEAVPVSAVGGGFIGRTIVVMESERRTINDLLDPPEFEPPSIKDLACYLKELAKLEGTFEIHPDAKVMYRDWYRKLALMQAEDTTGTIERLGDTVLKVAMLIALSHEPKLVIESEYMDEAIEKCTECVAGTRRLTMGSGKSELAYATSLVLQELIARPGNKITRKNLLSKYWGEFDSITLDRIVETIVQTDAVTATRVGQDIWYEMKEEYVETYKKFKRQVN